MNGLREFIERRRDEVIRLAQPLLERKKLLEAELARVTRDLKDMEQEWEELGRAAKAIGLETKKPSSTTADSRKESEITIKDGVLRVLTLHPQGLQANDILAELNRTYFDGRLERTSLSPQLSRLKNEGKIVLRGSIWHLAPRNAESSASRPEAELSKENEPKSGSEAGSKNGSHP